MRSAGFGASAWMAAVRAAVGGVLCMGLIPLQAGATEPVAGADLVKFQDCQADSDCVYAQNGSCDCNNGGTGVAVNKTKFVEFLKQFQPVTCTTIQGASCSSGVPRCEQKKCIYYARVYPHVYTGKKKN